MKLDHIVVYASNLPESADFYDRVLGAIGFRKTRDWVWANDDGFAVDLRAARSDTPYDRYGAGLNHFGFTAPSRAAFDQTIRALNAHETPVPDTQKIDGTLCLFLPDPDGLRIEITWEPDGASLE